MRWPAPRIDLAPGTPVALGIRPDMIILTDPDAEQAVRAQVKLVQTNGSDMEILLDTATSRFTAVVRERIQINVGDIVGFHVPIDKMHLFDQTSGRRLQFGINS